MADFLPALKGEAFGKKNVRHSPRGGGLHNIWPSLSEEPASPDVPRGYELEEEPEDLETLED
ncbi:hypothetical protein [Thermococcus sp.]|uniref:hypothetical protein n=1 Tax=Thermococcus sp. TaxID=35749 RepID=UPI00262A2984|nr:hypothetical protein [Thermococcus sp.]